MRISNSSGTKASSSLYADVYRAQQKCFSLLDLIRYSPNSGEDLSIKVKEATP